MTDQLLEAIRRRAASPETRVQHGDAEFELPPVTDLNAIRAAESQLDVRLPPFLVDLYTQVANGGFGPGFGIIGLPGGYVDEHGDSIVTLYESWRGWRDDDGRGGWRSGLVPICSWGCAIYSCVDCTRDGGPVVTSDPTPADDALVTLFESHSSVRAWVECWATGGNPWTEMYEPAGATMGINPFTNEPIAIPRYKPRGRRLS